MHTSESPATPPHYPMDDWAIFFLLENGSDDVELPVVPDDPDPAVEGESDVPPPSMRSMPEHPRPTTAPGDRTAASPSARDAPEGGRAGEANRPDRKSDRIPAAPDAARRFSGRPLSSSARDEAEDTRALRSRGAATEPVQPRRQRQGTGSPTTATASSPAPDQGGAHATTPPLDSHAPPKPRLIPIRPGVKPAVPVRRLLELALERARKQAPHRTEPRPPEETVVSPRSGEVDLQLSSPESPDRAAARSTSPGDRSTPQRAAAPPGPAIMDLRHILQDAPDRSADRAPPRRARLRSGRDTAPPDSAAAELPDRPRSPPARPARRAPSPTERRPPEQVPAPPSPGRGEIPRPTTWGKAGQTAPPVVHPSQEKRAGLPRVGTRLRARVRLGKGQPWLDALITTVSPRGLGVFIAGSAGPCDRVVISAVTPSGTELRLVGLVRWCRPSKKSDGASLAGLRILGRSTELTDYYGGLVATD